MREKREKNRKPPAELGPLDRSMATLVGSTRRTRRKKNLLEVAEELEVATRILGSRRAVGERIGLSLEMLREFGRVRKLCPFVKKMIEGGRLGSVDVAYRLSMLPDSEQKAVALAYVSGKLTGQEVKEIVPLRKRNPGRTIEQVMDRVKSSRDVVHYLIKFRLPKKRANAKLLRRRFADVLGNAKIVSLETERGIATLTVTEDGQNRLRAAARGRGVTTRALVRELVHHGEA